MPQSSARAALAAAITELRSAESEHSRLIAADRPSLEACSAARDAVERAEVAVAAAMAGEVERRVGLLAGGGQIDVASRAVEQARQAEQRARDELGIANAARDTVAARLREIDGALPDLRRRIEEAARLVLLTEGEPAMQAMSTEIDSLRHKLADVGGAATYMLSLAPPRWSASDPDPFAELRRHQAQIHLDGGAGLRDTPGLSPTAQKWRDCFDALKRDAGAKLPR
ncbi:MAG TPA: hypothetical protein VFQ90_19965 [Stellaceae bacterium]|nr:hypothetical protein [Stellaceae bacterium]